VSSGDVDLYLSKSWDTKPYLDPATKSVVSYLESSSHVGKIDESIILNSAKISEMCSSDQYCYFILGVYGSNMGTLAPAASPAGGKPEMSRAPTISLSPTVASPTGTKSPSSTPPPTTSPYSTISPSISQSPAVAPVAHFAENRKSISSAISHLEAQMPSTEAEAEAEVEAASRQPQSCRGTSSYSSFSLLYSTFDSITDLQDASPAVGRCSSTTGRYYRYVIREPNIVSQTISCNDVSC
jgi:hypothetical protein